MAVHYQTQGFIFKKADQGEADRLFTVFTKDFGKLEILGKAIRKIKSKLRGGTDIFYFTDLEFIQGKTYKTLTEALLIEKFPGIRKKLVKLRIAHKITEVLDNLLRGEEKDPRVWNLLINTFKELNQESKSLSQSLLLYYYFLWNFLSLSGYGPELYNCIFCQKKLTPSPLYFNYREGGIMCDACLRKTKKGQKISSDLIKLLRFFLGKDWPTVSRLKINESHLKHLKIISEDYLSFISSQNKERF